MGKSTAHQKYRTKDGVLVPGVTTVIGVLAKPALVPWANKLGLQGIEVGKYVDNLADVGTLAHLIIECSLKDKEVDYSDFTPNQRKLAEKSADKFFEWRKKNPEFAVISSELQLVSEKHYFGGTLDLYAELNGQKTLIDIKTSKACYSEHFTQVAGYKILAEENGYAVENCLILRVGRDDSEGFDEKQIPMVDVHAEKFLACLKILQLDNKLKEKKL